MSDDPCATAAVPPPPPARPDEHLIGVIEKPRATASLTHAQALQEVDRLNRAITRVLRLLADQETYCGDERLDVPSWAHSVRKALNDE